MQAAKILSSSKFVGEDVNQDARQQSSGRKYNRQAEFLYETVLKKVSSWGTDENLMFVIGATKASDLEEIRKIIPDHFLLVPGVGFQGGSLKEVSKYGMNKDCGLLVNASRAIIYAGEKEDFATEARYCTTIPIRNGGLSFIKKILCNAENSFKTFL